MIDFIKRPLEEKDYEILKKWWKWFKFPPPSRNFLPDGGLGGLMIETEINIPVCAGFLYITNSDVCWLEYIISNPQIKDKNIRKACLEKLIESLCKIAKEQDYKYVYTSCKHESLLNRYLDTGFKKGSTNTTELLKIL